jgi:hypothetical protein
MKITQPWWLAVGSVLLATQFFATAEDAYFQLPVSELKLTEGSLPVQGRSWAGRRWQLLPAIQAYAVLDGPGEVYVQTAGNMPWMPRSAEAAAIAIRAPRNTEITGRLFVPQADLNGMVQLKFKVAPAETKPDAKGKFFEAKLAHYQRLGGRNIPGTAWFRHQALAAAKELGRETNSGIDVATGLPFGTPPWRESQLEDTYDLFTGGRALSENLQLDRVLPSTKSAEETVAITNLAGISVKEMNWKELMPDAKPDLDPLAAFIPADQHAIFFPSFQAMTQLIDEADANGTPVLQLMEPRAENADSRTRYQQQLCLGLSEISRLLGPQVVASVAFTGSDPFLRVGTDLAIVFEARNPELLKDFLGARQKAAQASNAAAKFIKGEVEAVSYTGLVSPDRSVSSYIASVSNVVLVSNSRGQLENLLRVARGKAAPLSSQDEYIFFRSRYPRTDKSETAFVVLTDATIRRWCGPKWRIADSRRTRAAAVLSALQAAHLEELASGKVTEAVLLPGFNVPDAGEFRLTRSGVTCSTYGTLDFMTPIVEIPLTRVTRAEADAYQRWRDSYQRNWRQFFDPIALRFSLAPNSLGAALTVMPLILATDYRQFIDFSSGAQIAPDAGDPHTNTLLHLVFAINPQSQAVQNTGNFIGNMAPGLKANPFGWLGQSIALYAEEDSFWDRLKQATNADMFMEQNFPNLPLALHCEVKNPLGLAGFLTALHAFVDQSAPGMTTWQNLDYRDQAYVKVTSKEQGEKPWALYYTATPRLLTVTLSEPLLKRALDRQSSRATTETRDQRPADVSPWLGKNLCASAEHAFFEVLQILTRDTDQARLQLLAWNNLPILNEWKRLFPAKDPVKLHEQFWGVILVCPGGGAYVWNEKWHTMESTVFGHPGEPKGGSSKALSEILSAQLGVTFENQGLSASGRLNRKSKP